MMSSATNYPMAAVAAANAAAAAHAYLSVKPTPSASSSGSAAAPSTAHHYLLTPPAAAVSSATKAHSHSQVMPMDIAKTPLPTGNSTATAAQPAVPSTRASEATPTASASRRRSESTSNSAAPAHDEPTALAKLAASAVWSMLSPRADVPAPRSLGSLARSIHFALEATQLPRVMTHLALLYLHRLLACLDRADPIERERFLAGVTVSRKLTGSHFSAYHRLFTVSLALADTYLDDHAYAGSAWAQVAGDQGSRIWNRFYVSALDMISWRLDVSEADWKSWRNWLGDWWRSFGVTNWTRPAPTAPADTTVSIVPPTPVTPHAPRAVPSTPREHHPRHPAPESLPSPTRTPSPRYHKTTATAQAVPSRGPVHQPLKLMSAAVAAQQLLTPSSSIENMAAHKSQNVHGTSAVLHTAGLIHSRASTPDSTCHGYQKRARFGVNSSNNVMRRPRPAGTPTAASNRSSGAFRAAGPSCPTPLPTLTVTPAHHDHHRGAAISTNTASITYEARQPTSPVMLQPSPATFYANATTQPVYYPFTATTTTTLMTKTTTTTTTTTTTHAPHPGMVGRSFHGIDHGQQQIVCPHRMPAHASSSPSSMLGGVYRRPAPMEPSVRLEPHSATFTFTPSNYYPIPYHHHQQQQHLC